MQKDLSILLCKELVDDPLHFFDHVRRFASRIIVVITYGIDVNTADTEVGVL